MVEFTKGRHFFDTNNSPIQPASLNNDTLVVNDAGFFEDWHRLGKESPTKPEKATINGIPLGEFIPEASFSTITEIKNFFKDVLLANTEYNEAYKEQIINNHLVKVFHQGGYLYPVSTPTAMFLATTKPRIMMAGGQDSGFKKINIIPTQNGFKIQEVFTCIKLCLDPEESIPPALKKELKDNDERAFFAKPNKYLLEASALVDIDFSKDPEKPRITVEESYISYGTSWLRKMCDKRNPLQMLIDFFKSLLGLYVVNTEGHEKTNSMKRL